MLVGYDHNGKELADKVIVQYNCKYFFSEDYPDVVHEISKCLIDQDERAILICKTGIGMSISANRYKHIRAALVHDIRSVEIARKHNDTNVLCIGSQKIQDDILKMIDIFIHTSFEAGRHADRLKKI